MFHSGSIWKSEWDKAHLRNFLEKSWRMHNVGRVGGWRVEMHPLFQNCLSCLAKPKLGQTSHNSAFLGTMHLSSDKIMCFYLQKIIIHLYRMILVQELTALREKKQNKKFNQEETFQEMFNLSKLLQQNFERENFFLVTINTFSKSMCQTFSSDNLSSSQNQFFV